MKQFFQEMGIELSLLFAGLAGALASITKENELTIGQRLITVLVGGFLSSYLTPLVSLTVNMPDQAKYGLGFVIGYSGLRSVEWVMQTYFKKNNKEK